MSGRAILTLANSKVVERATEKVCENCDSVFTKDTRNTWAYWEKARFCSSKCAGLAHSRAATEGRLPICEAFARWVVRSDGCWEWKGSRDKDGYAVLNYAGKQYKAHVLALEFDGRPTDASHPFGCHTCDNPGCIRPDHLYPGTHAQNVADAVSRGRNVKGDQCHAAKLSEAQVREIRASDDHPECLAAQYGVSRSNIFMIRSRRTWRHVP